MEDEKNDKALKDAKKILTKISSDEHERYLADLREKYILDQQAYIETGYEKGHKAGIEEGIELGIEQGIERIIHSMLEQNLSLEEISKLTKIDIEKIKQIAKRV